MSVAASMPSRPGISVSMRMRSAFSESSTSERAESRQVTASSTSCSRE